MEVLKRFIGLILLVANIVAGVALVISAHSGELNPSDYRLAPYFGLMLPLFIVVIIVFLLLGIWKFRPCLAVSAVAIICSFQAIHNYFPINGKTHPLPRNAIKVMTYNVGGYKLGSKPNKLTTPIIDYIADQNPDICCLQEFSWVNSKNKAGEVLSYKKAFPQYEYVHFSQFDVKGWGGRSCLVLLSKYPIVNAHQINYKSASNASMVYELEIGGKILTVINNHLQTNELSVEDRKYYRKALGELDFEGIKKTRLGIFGKYGRAATVRAQQAKAVRAEIERAPWEVIVCGDFNDTQQSYAYKLIKGDDLGSAFVDAGFGPGITFNAHWIYFRIDHILHSQKLKPYNCEVDKVLYSDHYPVSCHFTF